MNNNNNTITIHVAAIDYYQIPNPSFLIMAWKEEEEEEEDEEEEEEEEEDRIKIKEVKYKYSCKLCFLNTVEICIIPCKHMVTCHMCIGKIKQNKCPYCNCTFKYIIHTNNNDSDDDDDDNDKRRLAVSKKSIKSFRCKICITRFAEVICLPCRHLCICLTCFSMQDNNIHQCPKCCKKVTNTFAPLIVG